MSRFNSECEVINSGAFAEPLGEPRNLYDAVQFSPLTCVYPVKALAVSYVCHAYAAGD